MALIVLAYVADAASQARVFVSALTYMPTGSNMARPIGFWEGAWVIYYSGLFLTLVGWTLKAPWDRCAQRLSDLISKFYNFLSKPDRFSRSVAAFVASWQVHASQPLAQEHAIKDGVLAISRTATERNDNGC
ncbi:hypothetical protein [Sphingomonas aerolata]|uniref:hypothetical protein n=1 Tax=Sphingomonas aerolata TaxID=185951 RepID=UPI002FE1AC26